MECKRCGNKDPSYFYRGHKGFYCRKCIRFGRILLDEDLNEEEYPVDKENGDYFYPFELTVHQQKASEDVLSVLKRGKDVLLHCVCGAGKTELTVQAISYYLTKGYRVGFAIPRREVVKELQIRFSSLFPKAAVRGIYGGHHDELTGDLLIMTTHQLFRYYRSFDLLILDEADGFPLKGDDTLMNIALRSCKGQIVFSTATVNDFLSSYLKGRDYEKVELFFRPSYHPLAVPHVNYLPSLFHALYLFFLLKREKRKSIVFLESKKECLIYYELFRKSFSCTCAYSSLNEKEQNISDFREGRKKIIFSTTLLERGMTFKGIDCYVLIKSRQIFDETALIQIAGRVGRDIKDPDGTVRILSSVFSPAIRNCICSLKTANEKLSLLLQADPTI